MSLPADFCGMMGDRAAFHRETEMTYFLETSAERREQARCL
jgi:hypothetical protein